MEIIVDTENITEAGFDVYLNRNLFDEQNGMLSLGIRTTTDANSITGGTIGSEGIIYLGSQQFRLDGRNKRITIEDKILIGYPS